MSMEAGTGEKQRSEIGELERRDSSRPLGIDAYDSSRQILTHNDGCNMPVLLIWFSI